MSVLRRCEARDLLLLTHQIPRPELRIHPRLHPHEARYKRGAARPDGTTRFRFTGEGLDFSSSAYDWLVVNRNSANAQFKGTGTIDGRPGAYDFMLWAGDSDGGDTFRIRIWSHGDESDVVYDNGANEMIGGGAVIIHTGK